MAHASGRWGLGTAFAAGIGMATAAGAAVLATPAPVEACGGLFCSTTNPVNQAAEQIIFSDNGDGTVTAVIQILYQGPAHEFAWVLPIPGNPTVGVSSTQALDVLKQATNPTYQLNPVLGPGCNQIGAVFGMAGAGASAGPPTSDSGNPGVSVLASGAIGPYLYDTIAVDLTRPDPADAAIDWLDTNGYDVGSIGPDKLRPYLEDGLNLIAFKLSSTSTTGSIRPVMITYDATRPSIPIRPTAVAANDDMGVLVWLLSDARGIPENYKALELNEALIDWFNPNDNYNDVVSLAADEAAGQGFVTEYAGTTDGSNAGAFIEVFAQWQKDNWARFQATPFTDPVQMVQQATANWSGLDGLDEAFAATAVLPATITIDDFKNCMVCYLSEPGVVFNTTTYLQKLYELVIKPMIETQKLLDQRPYLTRLYTTMSAEEMTMDPVFAFNPDLEDVSNRHTANRVIDCKSGLDPFASGTPWSVQLPQGDVVRGSEPGVWPVDIETQPAALRILQYATEGQGDILEDRSDMIASALNGLGGTPTSGDGGSSGKGASTGGTGGRGGGGATTGDSAGMSGASDGDAGIPSDGGGGGGGGCSAAGGGASGGRWAFGLALAWLVRRRRAA